MVTLLCTLHEEGRKMSLRLTLLLLLSIYCISPSSAYPSFGVRRSDSLEVEEKRRNESHIILVEEVLADDRRASYAINRRNRLQDLRKFYPNLSEKDLIMMLLSRPPVQRKRSLPFARDFYSEPKFVKVYT